MGLRVKGFTLRVEGGGWREEGGGLRVLCSGFMGWGLGSGV